MPTYFSKAQFSSAWQLSGSDSYPRVCAQRRELQREAKRIFDFPRFVNRRWVRRQADGSVIKWWSAGTTGPDLSFVYNLRTGFPGSCTSW
jgi:hypothetical protein